MEGRGTGGKTPGDPASIRIRFLGINKEKGISPRERSYQRRPVTGRMRARRRDIDLLPEGRRLKCKAKMKPLPGDLAFLGIFGTD